MFTSSRYKRSQGRIARQLTFLALAAIGAIGAWKISEAADGNVGRYLVPLAVVGATAWAAFRVVNIPSFADFLIAVEAEMNKVSWPTRSELFRASLVVIVVIFLLTLILLLYDTVLRIVIGWMLGGG